jgi:hypothetical protein
MMAKIVENVRFAVSVGWVPILARIRYGSTSERPISHMTIPLRSNKEVEGWNANSCCTELGVIGQLLC